MIWLLTGSNDFAVRRAQDELIDEAIKKHGVHAVQRVDGEEFDPARLTELLQGMSLFASERLVVMWNAGKHRPLWEALGEWSERVPPEVTLVIVEPAPDKRTRTYKQLQKHGRVQEFPSLQEPALAPWLVAEAKAQGARLSAGAAAHLVRRAGADQWLLWSELCKLAAATSGDITDKLIDELVEPSPQANVFELLDAALQGRGDHMTELLSKLKASEDPYKLFGLLVSQVHTFAVVASASGKPAEAVAKEASIHPFVVRKMQSLTRHIASSQLRNIIATIAATDVSMKSTGVDPWVLVAQCLGKISQRSHGE